MWKSEDLTETIGMNRKRRIRMRFKACVRRVFENRWWLKDEVILSIQTRKSDGDTEKISFDFETKVAMNQKPQYRTTENIFKIVCAFRQIKDFQRFPFDLEGLAKYAQYQLLQNKRVIMREGHEPILLYVIMTGDVEVIPDPKEEDAMHHAVRTEQLHQGSILGDYGILYNKSRSATIAAFNNVELCVITKDVFNKYMREVLLSHYHLMYKALASFKHFEHFSQRDRTEISFYGHMQQYKDGDIIYSSQLRDVAFFVVQGSCSLIELLRVTRRANEVGKETFFAYSPRSASVNFESMEPKKSNNRHSGILISNNILKDLDEKVQQSKAPKKSYLAFSKKQWHTSNTSNLSGSNNSSQSGFVGPKQSTASRTSRVMNSNVQSENTAGILPTSEIKYQNSHLCRKLLRIALCVEGNLDPLAIDKMFMGLKPGLPYEPHFMQVATYLKTACFNIGEYLQDRFIVADTDTILLEIPKKVLAKQKYVIWEQVRRTLELYIPNNVMVFQKFVKDRMYNEYKNSIRKQYISPKDLCMSGNHIANVPYSIRLRHDFNYCDNYNRMKLKRKFV